MGKGSKKILIDVFYLVQATTGVKIYILELIEAIQSEKTENQYIFYPQPSKIKDSLFFKGTLTPYKKILFHGSYFLWKQLILPFYCFFKKIDILICPDYLCPILKFNTKDICVIHDAFFWQHPQNYNKHWLKYFKKMISLGIGRDTLIVTTSFFSKKKLENIFPTKNIEVIYQSTERLHKSIENKDFKILDKYNLVTNQYLLHVGYFDKRKNIPTLIKAFAQLSKEYDYLKLVLVGSQAINKTLDDYENILELIKQYKLENKVIFTGYLDDDSLQKIYKNALIYVFPSYNEGFGIPVLEAFYYELPVIVSNEGALQEIGDNAVLIFDVFNEKDLSEKIGLLLNNEALRNELVEKGKKRLTDFSRKKFFYQFKEIINNIK